jgi:hypothetical protein
MTTIRRLTDKDLNEQPKTTVSVLIPATYDVRTKELCYLDDHTIISVSRNTLKQLYIVDEYGDDEEDRDYDYN